MMIKARMFYWTYSLLMVFVLLLVGCKQEASRPNIVYILADDLGYGDLSCYGQQKFKTPNIDRLAKQGMLFTQHYAGSTVCSPSRSALLTGQTTGHTPVRGNIRVEPVGNWPLEAEAYTLAEMLQKSEYVTGAFGKWGLGYLDTEGDPNLQGFDEFYGFYSQTLAHHYFPDQLWHNDEKIVLTGNRNGQEEQYAPDLIHREALKFLEDNAESPFFLYYASALPHAEMKVPEEELNQYAGQFDPETAYDGVDYGEERFRMGP
ncbi:sulfatase-like hydrolase/transferase [Reichenbachiella ulvae]|uniref:Sulfatase-like hydrolase/transferase n=1 Tax=Reichenbachiella ulvae TaxID=2980104 RepID=A0ABT3CUJ5_9BACT|nr:sulfatase-like hydrolase/transferase [Reichenbachiella ulvae]MCV9387348.1 sulfatase-like hydrolase/transferase [Reichenbachiella ulvae]